MCVSLPLFFCSTVLNWKYNPVLFHHQFVELLQEAPNGVIDLKTAADMLAVRQKRRIYDITNVLEGIGLYVRYYISKRFSFSFPNLCSSFFHYTPMQLS